MYEKLCSENDLVANGHYNFTNMKNDLICSKFYADNKWVSIR